MRARLHNIEEYEHAHKIERQGNIRQIEKDYKKLNKIKLKQSEEGKSLTDNIKVQNEVLRVYISHAQNFIRWFDAINENRQSRIEIECDNEIV